MRCLVPLENDQGLQSKVSAHFGRAQFYAIVSYEKPGAEAKVEIRSAPSLMHGGGCGAADIIRSFGVDAVIVKGIGIRAIQVLREIGVKVYKTGSETLDQVIEELRNERIMVIDDREACEGSRGGLSANR